VHKKQTNIPHLSSRLTQLPPDPCWAFPYLSSRSMLFSTSHFFNLKQDMQHGGFGGSYRLPNSSVKTLDFEERSLENFVMLEELGLKSKYTGKGESPHLYLSRSRNYPTVLLRSPLPRRYHSPRASFGTAPPERQWHLGPCQMLESGHSDLKIDVQAE